MPKRNCTSRAAWRLQTGRSAEALSANYRLDCDYGTAVIGCWEKGGSEPIYVCESHAKQLGPSREHGPEARILTAESEQKEKPVKREKKKAPESAIAKASEAPALEPKKPEPAPETRVAQAPEAVGTAEASSSPADAEAAEKPGKREETTATHELAAAKPNSAALPETKRPEAAKGPEDATKANEAKVVEPKVGRAASDASARGRTRDLAFGNPAKAMVDEAIWNLAAGDYEVYRSAVQQGKPAREAAQAAGGQLAMIHQKIGDYTVKLEGLLSEATATISVGETIDKPLETATLEIIGSEGRSDSEKDAAIQQLGEIQEWVKQGLQGEMTAPQANQIVLKIGERVNWGGNAEISEELKAVYRTLSGNLKSAICAAVPKAQNVQERLTNLYAAKSEVDRELLNARELTQASR